MGALAPPPRGIDSRQGLRAQVQRPLTSFKQARPRVTADVTNPSRVTHSL